MHIGYRIDTFKHQTATLINGSQWLWQKDNFFTYTHEHKIIKPKGFEGLVVENPVKIIIHGFGENSKQGWIGSMRDTLLKKAMANQVYPVRLLCHQFPVVLS